MFGKMNRLGAGLGLVCAVGMASGQCDQWLPGLGDPGLSHTANSGCAWDPDGLGPIEPRITVAYNVTGSTPPGRVRAWNGLEWEAVGPEFNVQPSAVTTLGGQLVALGSFTMIGSEPVQYAAIWDGSAWRQLGSDAPAGGAAPIMFEGMLHVRTSGGVWRWDGSTWQQVGPSLSGIRTLGTYAGKLVAGGQFFVGGAPSLRNIAMLDGGVWRPLGSGTTREVNALVEFEGSLIAGGFFTTAGGRSVANIARWNGTSWSAMGGGLPSEIDSWGVNTLVVHEGQLIAGGAFEQIGTTALNGLARWDGSAWKPMASGVSIALGSPPGVRDLEVVNGELIALGGFELSSYYSNPIYLLKGVAKWDQSEWKPVGPGYVATSLFAYDGAVVAPGRFGQYMGFPLAGLARWDGAAWSPYAVSATFSPSGSFAGRGNELLAGGRGPQTPAGSEYVGHWNGSAWTLLGGAANNSILAVSAEDGSVVAGGMFTQMAGSAAGSIAEWDGSSWSAMGSGMNGRVNAVERFGGQVIAGGQFTKADGLDALNIAAWDGSQWRAMGSGLNGVVFAMRVFDGGLMVAGDFTVAGGATVNHIARWDGAAWSAVGGGMDDAVRGLALFDDELIAIGEFTMAGGSSAAHIAAWDGSAWRGLGSGLDGTGLYAAAMGRELLVTGSFDRAGGEVAGNFARWKACSPCRADLNGDGIVDFVDYLAFLTAFDGLDPIADLNGDGFVDFPDYLEFLTAYDMGCG